MNRRTLSPILRSAGGTSLSRAHSPLCTQRATSEPRMSRVLYEPR